MDPKEAFDLNTPTEGMKPLTKQQAAIAELANRGYPAQVIARYLKINPSLVPDQIGLMRRKGYRVRLLSSHEAKRTLDIEEAKRIAREAKP